MEIYFANPANKKVVRTVLFYLVSALSIFLIDKAVPSGPCNPGLGHTVINAVAFYKRCVFCR